MSRKPPARQVHDGQDKPDSEETSESISTTSGKFWKKSVPTFARLESKSVEHISTTAIVEQKDTRRSRQLSGEQLRKPTDTPTKGSQDKDFDTTQCAFVRIQNIRAKVEGKLSNARRITLSSEKTIFIPRLSMMTTSGPSKPRPKIVRFKDVASAAIVGHTISSYLQTDKKADGQKATLDEKGAGRQKATLDEQLEQLEDPHEIDQSSRQGSFQQMTSRLSSERSLPKDKQSNDCEDRSLYEMIADRESYSTTKHNKCGCSLDCCRTPPHTDDEGDSSTLT